MGLKSKKQQELTVTKLGLICKEMYPASMVDKPTFRVLLKMTYPRNKLPSRKFPSKAVLFPRSTAWCQRPSRWSWQTPHGAASPPNCS